MKVHNELDYIQEDPEAYPDVDGRIFDPSVVIEPENLDMHENSRFDSFVLVNCAGGVSIGDQSVIHAGSRVTGSGGLSMGKRSVVTYNAVLVTSCPRPSGAMSSMVPKREVNRDIERITLEDEVFVGSNSLIAPGVTLHEGSVIGAGCYIDRDVPPWTIIYPDGTTKDRIENAAEGQIMVE